MRKIFAKTPWVVLALVLGAPTTAWAGYNEGVAAYKRGDYTGALQELRPLAEHGDDSAQLFLGGMYLFGRGVQQDDSEAIKWYRKAAARDNAKAEFRLGRMYFAGRGVKQDIVAAHMWFIISASHQHRRGIKWRDVTAKRMTLSQIDEAQRRASEWISTFGTRKAEGNTR